LHCAEVLGYLCRAQASHGRDTVNIGVACALYLYDALLKTMKTNPISATIAFDQHGVHLLARIWPTDRTGIAPIDYRAPRSGILAGRHFPGLVKAGDCMAVVAVQLPD